MCNCGLWSDNLRESLITNNFDVTNNFDLSWESLRYGAFQFSGSLSLKCLCRYRFDEHLLLSGINSLEENWRRAKWVRQRNRCSNCFAERLIIWAIDPRRFTQPTNVTRRLCKISLTSVITEHLSFNHLRMELFIQKICMFLCTCTIKLSK